MSLDAAPPSVDDFAVALRWLGGYWVTLIVIPSRRNFRGEESSGATVGTTFHCRSLASLGMTSSENIKLTHHRWARRLDIDEGL